MAPATLDFSDGFRTALYLMEHGDAHVFVTGRAGTGKSTLLRHFVRSTSLRVAVLAPTGVAALNAGGETVHSFFGFKPDVTVDRVRRKRYSPDSVYRNLDVIVIDEVSMLRADLLDCVDRFLRLNGPDGNLPFGGVRMIFVGDLYQLPPVVPPREREVFSFHYDSPYFFSAAALRECPLEAVELEKVYRQTDPGFLRLLNGIRGNAVSAEDLEDFNRACMRGGPPEGADSGGVHLVTTNRAAAAANEERLAGLPGGEVRLEASVEGGFDETYFPADAALRLKEGARVMLLTNDPFGRWVNGSLGQVEGFVPDRDAPAAVTVRFESGRAEDIRPFTWEVFRFAFNRDTLAVEAVPAGRFTQFPLKLSWAVTIHKSQGKTFDRITVDPGHGMFAHGQAYVALSRCTSPEGVLLLRPLRREHLIVDPRVARFLASCRARMRRDI